MARTLTYLQQLIYPSFCANCPELIPPEDIFCQLCTQNIKPIVSVFLPLTKKTSLKVLAAGAYENPMKPLVLKKFYRDLRASKQLANIILQTIPKHELNADLIIPIPLHWTRYAWRGYNQAHEIAKFISQQLHIPMLNILKRHKKTLFQSRLTKEERQENVNNVFTIRSCYKQELSQLIKHKKIIIIDDLFTTGATLQSAAKLLTHAQPTSITGIVGCRALQ